MPNPLLLHLKLYFHPACRLLHPDGCSCFQQFFPSSHLHFLAVADYNLLVMGSNEIITHHDDELLLGDGGSNPNEEEPLRRDYERVNTTEDYSNDEDEDDVSVSSSTRKRWCNEPSVSL